MSFEAYIDASGKDGSDFFVMAGFVAPSENWQSFYADWQNILDIDSRYYGPPMPYFKMAQMDSPARLERCELFYRIIEKHVIAAVSCVIDVRGLERAVRKTLWPENFYNVPRLENPYFFGFKAITDVLAQYQKGLGLDKPVNFIFDSETEEKQLIGAWEQMKEVSRLDVRKLMGDRPIFRDDKKVLPLQAGDFFAWWVRKWHFENVDWMNSDSFPWKKEKNIPGLNMVFSENDFLSEFEKGLASPLALARAAAATQAYK